jgi:hypothetical protein
MFIKTHEGKSQAQLSLLRPLVEPASREQSRPERTARRLGTEYARWRFRRRAYPITHGSQDVAADSH